jgi:hypothetical protein
MVNEWSNYLVDEKTYFCVTLSVRVSSLILWVYVCLIKGA